MSAIDSELAVVVIDGLPPTIRLIGQASFRSRSLLVEKFNALIEAGCNVIKADLSELDYIDSSAISALVKCATTAADNGIVIEITGASPHVARILTLCGAAVFFKSSLPHLPDCSTPACRPPSGGHWNVSHFQLPATPASASVARKRISDLIRSLPLASADRQDLLAAVGEALTNAIKHGCRGNPKLYFTVRCIAGPSRVIVDVEDPGPGFDPARTGIPEMDSTPDGGMGIFIMRSVMDEVSFDFASATRVRLVKNIRFPARFEPEYSRNLAGIADASP